MRGRLGRRSGAAAAILLATLAVLPASPASATPVITIDSPRAEPPLQSASVTVRGTAKTDVLLATIKRITLSLNGKQTTVACTEATCAFEWAQSLPLNGPYEVTVAAVDGLPLLAVDGDATVGRRFAIAAPAAKPVMDPPKVTAARTVELSWSRNTEADMLHYLVTRTDPGGNKSLPVKVPQPTTGSKVTLSDTTTSALGGGAYSYQVEAVRKGATGTEQSQAKSEASGAVSATVPAPLPTSSSTTPAVPGAPASGPTTTAKPAPPGGVDLSGFLSSRSQPITRPTITVPEPPDTGFSGSLPFGARPPGTELEEGEADAVLPRDGSSSSMIGLDGGRPLVPVAGGLVLLLLALHMRLLSRRVKAAPDRDLPVDHVRPAPAVAATVTSEPVAEAKPPPAFYDVMAEVDDDEWAPMAVDDEPELHPQPAHQHAPAPERFDPEPLAGAEVAGPVAVPADAAAAPEPGVLMPEPEPELEPEPVAAADPPVVAEPAQPVSADRSPPPLSRRSSPSRRRQPARSSSPALRRPPPRRPSPAVQPVATEPPAAQSVASAKLAAAAAAEPPATRSVATEPPAAAPPVAAAEPTPAPPARSAARPLAAQPAVAAGPPDAAAPAALRPAAPQPAAEPPAEPAPDIVSFWAPPPPAEEPEPDEPDPDEIVVVEVVSSSRRRLVRAGGR